MVIHNHLQMKTSRNLCLSQRWDKCKIWLARKSYAWDSQHSHNSSAIHLASFTFCFFLFLFSFNNSWNLTESFRPVEGQLWKWKKLIQRSITSLWFLTSDRSGTFRILVNTLMILACKVSKNLVHLTVMKYACHEDFEAVLDFYIW